jgi:hypothetical protein
LFVIEFEHVCVRILVNTDKLRFQAVSGVSTVFDIDVPVQNSQRQNALTAIRWQVEPIAMIGSIVWSTIDVEHCS